MAGQARAAAAHAGHGPVPTTARLQARWPERSQMPQSLSAGHYGGPRGPPGTLVQIVVIHTEPGGPHLFKIIHPCRRRQRPWTVQLDLLPRAA